MRWLLNQASSALAASNAMTVAISIHSLRIRIGLASSKVKPFADKGLRTVLRIRTARVQPGLSHTSTHSAAVSSAIRAGVIRTALWVEPAAGTTSSNALSDTSQ